MPAGVFPSVVIVAVAVGNGGTVAGVAAVFPSVVIVAVAVGNGGTVAGVAAATVVAGVAVAILVPVQRRFVKLVASDIILVASDIIVELLWLPQDLTLPSKIFFHNGLTSGHFRRREMCASSKIFSVSPL